MIWKIFSPGKVSSCCPGVVWREVQLGAGEPRAVPASSNNQGLFEKGLLILLIFLPSRRWPRRRWRSSGHISVWQGWEESRGICPQSRTSDRKRMMMTIIWTPVHLPMVATVTITSNCYEPSLPLKSTSGLSAVFKSERRLSCFYQRQSRSVRWM